MDEITEDALSLLRRDGRLSFSELARLLDTTRAAIAGRIGPMLDSGALRVVAAVHPRALGLDVMTHLSIRISGEVAPVAAAVGEHTPAVFVSETVGPDQLIAEVHTRSLSDLQEILRFTRALPGVTDVRYLIYEHVLNSFFLGAEPQGHHLDLDEADSVIIAMLQHDGRATYAALAEGSGLSITAVRARMRKLIDSGVMRIGALGQRSDSAGNLVFGLGLNLDDANTSAEEAIGARRGLEFMARTIGRYDLIATLPFTSLNDYNAFMDDLRRMDGVRKVDAWLHANIRQERYQLRDRKQ